MFRVANFIKIKGIFMKTNFKKTALIVSVVSCVVMASSSAMASACDPRTGQCTPDPAFSAEDKGLFGSMLDFLDGLFA